MQNQKAKYNIKAVSQMLNIQAGTLRAWERRYQIIQPVRNEAGHRIYTDEHLHTLKWLINKVNKGFTISQAIALLENNDEFQIAPQKKEERNHLEVTGDDLLQCLLSFDERSAQLKLEEAFSLFSPETVAMYIFSPILVETGNLWESKQITSAHENFVSNFLRFRIGMMLLSIPTIGDKQKALLVCGPNEHHELGLMIFALFLKRRGYDVVYLGQSPASGDLEIVIDEIKPEFIFLSCTIKKNIPLATRLVESLEEQFPTLEIGLGGYVYETMPELNKRFKKYIVGNTKSSWEDWLNARS
ncbi:MerR family transcriptional regulator [Halobacillus seohaensis]|uniref:MerR family transcriptional regulator n=1 Tax=Halobacillus seohaensis TaxID=447421 RepID=A0ABW2EDU8_9BACI